VLQLFRTNQFAANILLLFYIAILRFSSFIVPNNWEAINGGILSDVVFSSVSSTGVWANIISIILVFIQAFLINVIVGRYRILIASYIPEFLYLSPVLIANTFFIIGLLDLFETYKKPSCAGNIFNVGIWIGISSLFYFSYISFIVLAFFGLITLRAFKLRELLMLIFGIFTPYFLTGTYYYLIGDYGTFHDAQLVGNMSFLSIVPSNHWITYVKLAFFGVLMLLTILSINQYMQKKNIRVHKNLSILYWIMIAAGVAFVIQHNAGLEHLLLLSIPLGILLSFSMMNLRSQTAEAIHFILLFGAFVFQFQSYLMP